MNAEKKVKCVSRLAFQSRIRIECVNGEDIENPKECNRVTVHTPQAIVESPFVPVRVV